MADLEGVENASLKVGKDLFAGAVGGIAQVLMGRLAFVYVSTLCFCVRDGWMDGWLQHCPLWGGDGCS